ncbi:LuxR C-terminal-related transcriptional regulator [Salipaludibacillus sp. CF4.18]|uniref:LuxR C-terminal-related transcriptional regulator n=1 Tax=Salipaludibacillus sp. CF4.18 TaxID=3373081 RepID=UPI003EE77D65
MLSQINLSKSEYGRMMQLISDLSVNFKNGTDELQHLLSQYFGYHSSIFWKIDQKGNLSNPTNHNLSDYLVEDYVNYFYNDDYLHPQKHLDFYRENIVLRMEDVISLEEYKSSDYYKEFMKKYGQYHKMTMTFYSHNKFVGVLGICRPLSEKGFTEVDFQRARILSPIVSNLLYLEREYEELRQEKELLEAFASESDTGLILLDKKYEIIYMNQAVWDIYRETNVYKSMEDFVGKIVSNVSNNFLSSPMLRLQGYKIKIIGHQELFLSRESRYAIIIERDKVVTIKENDLCNELTMREKEVCFYLKKGCTYKEISKKLFISVHTVNKHAKNIYKKLGVNSRSLLQAKLLYE